MPKTIEELQTINAAPDKLEECAGGDCIAVMAALTYTHSHICEWYDNDMELPAGRVRIPDEIESTYYIEFITGPGRELVVRVYDQDEGGDMIAWADCGWWD
tara:strand:- start:8 stop:310 length:303 start_codon:yes stop_codon:yes gene_type:complete